MPPERTAASEPSEIYFRNALEICPVMDPPHMWSFIQGLLVLHCEISS